MQRSFSSSSADHRTYQQQSAGRTIPIRLVPNNKHDPQSDTESYHHKHLLRTSSTSSMCSTASTGSANYRILPVRYSSVDRVVQKPAVVTANERGINVRIRFQRPRSRSRKHHSHRHHHQHTEEYERHYKKETSTEHQRYASCPTLNVQSANSKLLASNRRPLSNINYIETRSIVRGFSSEQLNRNTHSNTLVIRQQSLPPAPPPPVKRPSVTRTRIQHIPLDTRALFRPVMARVIREEEECLEIDACAGVDRSVSHRLSVFSSLLGLRK